MADRPTVEQFRRALGGMQLSHALTPSYRRLLRAHYAAPQHTMTTLQLAEAMKWDTHSPVNAHYGMFGARLATNMRWTIPEGEPRASSLASFEGGRPDDPHTRWIMHPELAAALRELKIVPRRDQAT